MEAPPYPVEEWMPLLFYDDADARIRFEIVTEVMSSPTELPTTQEIQYILTAAQNYTEADVAAELDALVDADFLVRLNDGDDEYVFYGLSDHGKQFLVDSRHYRGQAVLKEVHRHLERPDEIIDAYEADRPDHPPATDEYEEHSYHETDAWQNAVDATYRTLTLTLERTGDTEFHAALTESDENRVLAEQTIHPDTVSDQTDDHREMDELEPRGTVLDDTEYGIHVRTEGGTYCLQPEKNGERWHNDIVTRDLYIFTERDT